jgi:hypothetical protein
VLIDRAIALWVPGVGGLYSYLRLRPRLLERAHANALASDTADHAPTGDTP